MGEWLEGLPHGKGVMYTPDGGFYVGEWTRGKPDGKGDLSLTTGLRYDLCNVFACLCCDHEGWLSCDCIFTDTGIMAHGRMAL